MKWCFPWLFLILLAACSTGKVITYAHSGANFPDYRTYKIQSHEKIAEISPKGYATYQRLDGVIADQMEHKGYRYHLQPDILVTYKISSGLSQNTRSTSTYDRYNWYYPNAAYWDRDGQQTEALIEVVMFDTQSKKSVWTGNADISLRRRGTNAEEIIKQKLLDILAQFPINTAP